MTAKLKNPRVAVGAALAAGVLVLAAGWLLLVSPARSESAELQSKIDTTSAEITTRRAAIARKPKIEVDVRTSDLYRLSKAVPDRTDMPGIVLELNRAARGTGVSFDSITPAQPVTGQGYNIQPVGVAVSGRFGEVNSFINRLRKLVTVRKSRLDARGRLFAIDSVTLQESSDVKFPAVQATIILDAFVYAGGQVAAPNGTAGTTTTPSNTSTPSPSGAVAAGATP